jgi:hypothetical protein
MGEVKFMVTNINSSMFVCVYVYGYGPSCVVCFGILVRSLPRSIYVLMMLAAFSTDKPTSAVLLILFHVF